MHSHTNSHIDMITNIKIHTNIDMDMYIDISINIESDINMSIDVNISMNIDMHIHTYINISIYIGKSKKSKVSGDSSGQAGRWHRAPGRDFQWISLRNPMEMV